MFIKNKSTVAAAPELEVREAAKGLFTLPNGLLVFAAGKRGMLNSVGGGLKPGEEPLDALYRETPVEIGVQPSELQDVEEVGQIEGRVTTAKGLVLMARWTIYRANVLVPFDELFIPQGSEITAHEALSRRQALESERVLPMAKRAVLLDMFSER